MFKIYHSPIPGESLGQYELIQFMQGPGIAWEMGWK